MFLGKIPVGRIVARTLETVLAAWIIKDALGLYNAGKPDAAVNNAIGCGSSRTTWSSRETAT